MCIAERKGLPALRRPPGETLRIIEESAVRWALRDRAHCIVDGLKCRRLTFHAAAAHGVVNRFRTRSADDRCT